MTAPDATASSAAGPSAAGPEADAARRAKRRRRRRQRLLALAVGFGLPLLALEIGVRIRHGHPVAQKLPLQLVEANRFRGWQLVPERDFYTYSELATINSLGFRGPEVEPRQPDELRIVALGDSMTFGIGVDDSRTLPALLERELEARLDRPVTVINTGHAAYSTNQEVSVLLEHGAVLDPDLAILFWFFNDIDQPAIESLNQRLTEGGPETFETRNAFTGWVAWKWRFKNFTRHSAICAWWLWRNEHHTLGRDGLGRWSRETVDAAFGALDVWMYQFSLIEQELGAKPAAVVIPFAPAIGDDEAARSHVSRSYDARALETIAGRGVPVLSVRPALEEASRELGRVPYLPYDYHWDADGNAAQARAVAEWLVETYDLEGLGR